MPEIAGGRTPGRWEKEGPGQLMKSRFGQGRRKLDRPATVEKVQFPTAPAPSHFPRNGT